MKKLITLVLMSLLITGAVISCATPPPKVAPPPLPERPTLKSMVKDRNDSTGEVGAWMNFEDLRRLTRYSESVEAVRRKWR
jgi:hypothetical protein